MIRAVQIELRRHRCYSGQINGDMEATDRALDTLGKTEPGKRSPYIVASRSNFEEFEAWLQWVRVIQNPICGREVAIPVAPAPKIKRPPPRPPKVVVAPRREQYRAPPRRRERDTEQSVSHTGVIGRGKGDYFAPTNPFYSPTR